MIRLHDVFFDPNGMKLEELQGFGTGLAEQQRGINWWIGDVAMYARDVLHLGENYSQVFPEWMSPGLIQRCEAVARAYPREEDRNPLATWAIHMQFARQTDRKERVAASVSKGQTTDEVRAEVREETGKPRWLLAIDVNYFLYRCWYSGVGVKSAISVAHWLQRSIERLREKGLTDAVCCFDSRVNNRKELTATWKKKYKDRPEKDPELANQLNLVRDLIRGHGLACASLDGYEADDVMASFAKQFDGRVTLLTPDKDCRQCLSATCNLLLDVEWTTDETSGEALPTYKWLSAKQHTEATGIPPEKWVEYQAISGDACDGIQGAEGIGAKGAADLVKEFGTVEAAISAAKADDERLKPARRKALIQFEPRLEVTRKLVTLKTDLQLNVNTRLT